MISDQKIIKLLGRDVIIYPFQADNLKGASVNLTASEMAWSIKTKQSIVFNDVIKIPANDTALIMTVETIYLSSCIAGTIHSKLSDICRGIGHDASTLNPGWIGRLVIPIHNYSSEEVVIRVGTTFVTMILEKLQPRSKKVDENTYNRTDLLYGIPLTETEKNQLYETVFTESSLKKRVKDERTYDAIKNSSKRWTIIKWVFVVVICLLAISIYLWLSSKSVVTLEDGTVQNQFSGIRDILIILITAITTAIATKVFD